MKRAAWTTIVLLLLTGCSARNGIVVYTSHDSNAANLTLGPARDHAWLAEVFAGRSDWPSTQSGYIFNDTSSYTEVIFDDQSYYNDFDGGGYTREAISIRSGILVR